LTLNIYTLSCATCLPILLRVDYACSEINEQN
jgi:hypothetical protein